MFSITNFIETYGYLTIFIGSIFEGETIVILGGLAAHSEYTIFFLVVVFAFLGAITGDWFFFFLGRYKNDYIKNRFPCIKNILKKPTAFMEKSPRIVSFGMRFVYGFRHVVPFNLGGTSIRTSEFIFWNILGAITWALIFTTIGYLMGGFLEGFLGNIKKYEFRIIVITIVTIVIFNFIIKNIRIWLFKNDI